MPGVIERKLPWLIQPQYPVLPSRKVSWLVNAGAGRIALLKAGGLNVPGTRAVAANLGGVGFEFVASGGGNSLGAVVPTAATDTCTFFSVFVLKSAVPWAGLIYDRLAWNGQALGADGLSYRYIWDGAEWAYDTGLKFGTNTLVAAAHSITPSTVVCAVNGKTNVRSGLANAARSFSGADKWFGQDPQDLARTLDGYILLSGLIHGVAWTEAELREWTNNPWKIFQPISRKIWVASAGGGLSAILGQPSETDTAQPISAAKDQAVGLNTETDTALAVIAVKTLAIGQATETDAAQTVTAIKTVALGLASETGTAQPLVFGLSATVGQAVETDTAQAVTASKTLTLGLVTESEFAQAITYYKTLGVLQPVETDSAHAITATKTATLGLITETDSALAVTATGGVGQTLTQVDLDAIAAGVWAHADAVAAHATLDAILARLQC